MLEKFERYPLTFGPTPIEKLSRRSSASSLRHRAGSPNGSKTRDPGLRR